MIDGRIRNVSDRTFRRLIVYYEVLDSDKKVLTRQQGSLDEAELEPGKEAAFSAQMQSHARAVYYRFEVTDGNGRELRGVNTGPFPLGE
ncbi:MAG: hypothetical protein H7039_03400 [Bryobacteraceae bacterium]|nr:hypothetical protein [Bryobacteraceae bacterium]